MNIDQMLKENQINILHEVDKINERELIGVRCQDCICKVVKPGNVIKSCDIPSCYNRVDKEYAVCKECSSEMGLCEICGNAIDLEIDPNMIIDRVERYVAILGEYRNLIESTYNQEVDLMSLNLAISYTMKDFCLDEYSIMKIIEGYEF